MQLVIIQQDLILVMNNGKKSWKFVKNENSLLYLIWHIKDLFLEMSKKMPSLWDCFAKMIYLWWYVKVLLKILVYMVIELVVFLCHVKIRNGLIKWMGISTHLFDKFIPIILVLEVILLKQFWWIKIWKSNGRKILKLWVEE